MRKRGSKLWPVSILFTVCLSITIVYCMVMDKDIFELFLGLVAPSFLFLIQALSHNSKGTPHRRL